MQPIAQGELVPYSDTRSDEYKTKASIENGVTKHSD